MVWEEEANYSSKHGKLPGLHSDLRYSVATLLTGEVSDGILDLEGVDSHRHAKRAAWLGHWKPEFNNMLDAELMLQVGHAYENVKLPFGDLHSGEGWQSL